MVSAMTGNPPLVIQKVKVLHMNSYSPPRGEGGHFYGKVIGMLVVFFRYKILDSGIFRVFWKVLCRNEILIFLGSAHFPYRVKMRSFQNSVFRAFKSKSEYFLGFSKKFPTSIPITSTLRVPPGIVTFTPGKSLRRFRKDNNYLEKFDMY